MNDVISFTVFMRAEPQGSKNAWVLPGKNGAKGRAIMFDQNASKMKPYRQEVTRSAMAALAEIGIPFADKHVPVRLELAFYFAKPASVPKKRMFPVVKPDLDKLTRSTCDALTGVLYADDAQIVAAVTEKFYGTPERVEIKARIAASEAAEPIHETELLQATEAEPVLIS